MLKGAICKIQTIFQFKMKTSSYQPKYFCIAFKDARKDTSTQSQELPGWRESLLCRLMS